MISYGDILIAIFLSSALMYAYLKWKLSYWKRKGMYSNPKSLIFGHCKDLILMRHNEGIDFGNFYEELRRKNLHFGGYYCFIKPIFVPIELNLVRRIMTKDFSYFFDRGLFCDEETAPLSVNLFCIKGKPWKHMRTKVGPCFTPGKIKMMFQTFLDTSKELTSYLGQLTKTDEPWDVKNLTARFTIDVILSCAFGLEARNFKEAECDFRTYGLRIFETTFTNFFLRFLMVMWPEMLSKFKLDPVHKDIRDFFTNAAKSTVEYREKNNIVRPDFMHLMIQLKNCVNIDENKIGDIKNTDCNKNKTAGITFNQLVAQALAIFIGGFETSASTSTFCLYELAVNPEIQGKLREEINQVLDKNHGNITYECLQEMTYMEKVIDETLRKYPIVPIHSRECTKDYNIPETNITIPKGCLVIIPIYAIQHDPEFYPDPEKFDPERFSSENIATRHPASYTPFGDGPRVCIGMRFGMVQVKTLLTTIIKNYELSLNPKTKSPLQFEAMNFILSADGGIWLDAKKIV